MLLAVMLTVNFVLLINLTRQVTMYLPQRIDHMRISCSATMKYTTDLSDVRPGLSSRRSH